MDRAGGGLATDLALYALSAVFALVTAVMSTLAPHRAWGSIAWYGYAAAALATLVPLALRRYDQRLRWVLTMLASAATVLVPLLLAAAQRAAGRADRAQEEVVVIERAGQRLLDHGTPYLAEHAIAQLPPAEWLLSYVPYQPAMALFGVPRALFGAAWWTDARVWFALATCAALATAACLLPRSTRLLRGIQTATVFPICALTLATGGDDLPVLALCLLALAYAARDRPVAAGLAAGAAAALKLFAWPVAAVLLVLFLTRGRRPALRYAAGAFGLPVGTLLPSLAADPRAALDNVVRFPLGHALVTSPAQSPFPGHLIATALPGGRVLAAALLVVAGLAIAVRLARRPPRTATAASAIIGYGLLAAILLMPSTRFGYLLYPVAFALWVPPLTQPGPQAGERGVHVEG
nr:glycosyltransferase 87 family protein [Micromonospora sp. NBRC 107566]